MNLVQLKKEIQDKELTMIPTLGLDNIELLLRIVKTEKIKGDFVETGVWRGGACMYARAVMNEIDLDGKVYVCDSFDGLPKPDHIKYPSDEGDGHYQIENLKVSKEVVESNFKEYGLLDKTVFIKGWFKDTMPELKKEIKSISILRLDGDMFESTVNVLDNLYDLVSIGGYIIVDDYCIKGCKDAIDEFYKDRNITSPFNKLDQCVHYFKKC